MNDKKTEDRAAKIHEIVEVLRNAVAEKKFVDIGRGAGDRLGISMDKLRVAVAILKDEGYEVHMVLANQKNVSPEHLTAIKVLSAPGTSYKDVNDQKHLISPVTNEA